MMAAPFGAGPRSAALRSERMIRVVLGNLFCGVLD